MKNQETLQVNSIISSNVEPQGLLPISPSSSQQTLAIMPTTSSSSLQLAPAASEGSTESKIEAQAQECMLPKDSPSTPTRYTISSALDQTPTSKTNAPTTAKKSYVLSISPKPTQLNRSHLILRQHLKQKLRENLHGLYRLLNYLLLLLKIRQRN